MSVQALGYIGLRAKDLGDWAKFGVGLPRHAAHRQDARLDGVPHGRPQAARHHRCRRRAGHRLLRLGGRGCGRHGGACREAGSRRREGRARLTRARRRAAREGPDRVSGPDRHAHRGVSRAGSREHAVHARPQHLGLPHRAARHGPCGAALRGHRADDRLLRRPARLPASATISCGRIRRASSTAIRAIIRSRSPRRGRTRRIT